MDRTPSRGKLEPRSRAGIFVGYSTETKGYRIWIPTEGKVVITRDVKFLEDTYRKPSEDWKEFHPEDLHYGFSQPSGEDDKVQPGQGTLEMNVDLLNHNTEDQHPDADNEEEEDHSDQDDFLGFPAVEAEPGNGCRRGRPRKIYTGRPGRPRIDRAQHAAEQVMGFLAEVTIGEALSGRDSREWMDAMASEVNSILQNDTWNLVPRPSSAKAIGSRFVLRNKYGEGGILERRKARIVAKGFSQRYGRDFIETFAPVARLDSIRLAVALAARNRMHIRQYDVATAYLNGRLDEDVYMEVPDEMETILEFIVRNKRHDKESIRRATLMLEELAAGDKVCHMNKALYGLKQAGRAWHKHLDRELRNLGATPTSGDPCVYQKYEGDKRLLIIVYVDDILAMSKHPEMIDAFGARLATLFEIKDLGELKRCLGIDFRMDDNAIAMTQRTYIEDVLRRFNMSDCNPVSTPAVVGSRLTKGEPWQESNGERPPYRELIGCLLYLAVATRPDISHVVSSLSQYNDRFGAVHWSAAKRVLRYLKGTMDFGISYELGDGAITGYVDADYGGSIDDRRSFTGYVFIMNGGAVTWDSRKQRTVAVSTTEAEYMALSDAAKEVLHLQAFLSELGVSEANHLVLFNDNFSAQKLATNPVFHTRTKHIDIRHHFVREVMESGKLILQHIPSTDMPADVLTKPLPKPKHQRCSQLLGLSRVGTRASEIASRGSVGITDNALSTKLF